MKEMIEILSIANQIHIRSYYITYCTYTEKFGALNHERHWRPGVRSIPAFESLS